ncbi:MAG TPA: chromosome segregation protein SMC [Candidatus Scatosoma pullistercoris]|uniref:Chromosome partition protein Smc n=1 Tax=Candidatus Scatosoma pullistercoris TaxID=2840934 RepID=A0A9D1SGL7_9FIRM|nr:chromosome segregation protein SMC [Candidatus Scatosoma pullistercoris]
MDLKEIQLVGFKSFADKTSIRFDDGVTCIVGPNGCGKSNVADAVRWVLGEQSAKSLRGTSMQDVIFGGTEARKPLSFCEVTLVFDNSKHIFDMDVTDVAMTRRLYRNGDSKYLINGQPSRLKDIVALFHGVGLGKEGYSIIGQGKVAQIMNSRAEDRRLIFEEATGLMVYKSRKQEIERKLEDSNSNLFIYRQRIDEAERRLGPLSKQAAAAREYNEYSESLKVNEANTYIYRYENAESEKDKFKRDISGISDQIISLNVQVEKINRQTEENRRKIAEADADLTELNDRRVELSVGNERKDGELKLVRERISTYRSQIAAATDVLEESKKRIGEIDDSVALSAKKQKADSERISAIENETDVLRSAISALDNKIAVFERLTDEKRMSQLSSAEDLSELKKNLGSISARKDATEERIKEIDAAIQKSEQGKERLQDELSAVRSDLKKLREFTSKGTQAIEEQTEEVREMQLTVNNFNQDLFNANGQIASLKDSLEVYISLKNRFEGYKDSVRRLLSVSKTNPDVGNRVKGALADIIRTEQKYETAIETAFGGAMQNVVTATSDDARYLIEYLKRTNGGVVTFLPVSSMRPKPDTREIQRALSEKGALGLATELVQYDEYYYNVISNLLGNTLICDNIFNANTIAKKYGNSFKIVTLDGDIVMTSGAMTGGSRRKDAGSLLSNERKIQECKENILRKQKYIEKLKVAIAESEKAREKAEEEVEKLRAKYQSSLSEQAALEQREAALGQQIENAEADIAVYREALQELNAKLEALRSEEENSSKSEEELNSLRADAEEQLTSQRSQCDRFRAEREEKSKNLHDLEVEYAALVSAVEKEEETVRRLTSEKEELVKRIMETEQSRKDFQGKLNELEAVAQEKELTEEERAAVQEIMDKIAAISKEKEEINARQAALEEEKTSLQERITKQSDKRYKCEIEISKIDTNLENMRLRIDEAYHMDYEGCLALRKEGFDVEEAATVIAVLKRKITMLGAVNPNAVEEYDEEKAHYDEMITQRDDLQKAIEDLTSALNDIREEMLRQFNEGFDKINEHFKTTFKELFGGGRAELQLDYVEGEDPLAAGVEIVACPPGKKLSKISLLSGGEQALTAIAILFAILKTNPMPFCILDEIEAALDDANVDRFASYLKRFSEDTQFIVITHRKPTMNQADSLFGVTMQEKGVSKIVSVKLAEVEQRLGAGTVE